MPGLHDSSRVAASLRSLVPTVPRPPDLETPRGPGAPFTGTSRFEVRRCLGAGGMGVVYEALDRELGTVVALKTLLALDPQSIYWLKREFRSLSELEHDNLVRLGELFFENGHWFFTMELVEGEELLDWVWTGPPAENRSEPEDDSGVRPILRPALDEERLRSALRQLAAAISALHGAGKVHRDIKPSNVLLTPAGRAVLLDFGLVTDVGDRAVTERSIVGTAAYMAPEQAAARSVGPEADWYSLGIVLFEALTGCLPFDGSPFEVLMDKQRREPAPPRSLVPVVPPDLDALCVDLLRQDPADRPTGAEILLRLGAVPPPPGAVPDARRPVARTPATHSPPFVGRSRELAALRAALVGSLAGTSTVVRVEGESGVGKSALVRRFLATPEALEALVLSGRCYERESVPYKAFDGIVDDLSRHLARLPNRAAAALLPEDAPLLARLFPVLRRVTAVGRLPEPRGDAGNPQERRTRCFGALREILVRLAETRPLILFVDDLQWADGDSLELLAEVMQPPDPPPLLLVATSRPRLGGGEDPLALLDPGDQHRVALAGLAPDEASLLATCLLDTAGAGALTAIAADVAAEAAGHPLFVQELVRHVLEGRSPSPRGVRLEEALAHRIGALEPAAQRLLQVVAVAGAPIAQSLTAQASELGAAEHARMAAVLRAGNLVRTRGTRGSDTIEAYHDRIREVVIDSLSDEVRRRHHGALADAYESSGAAIVEPQLLVRHLEAAGTPERAGQLAARAARFARDALAFAQSAELYRTALRLGAHGDAERRALLLGLGDVLVGGGRGTEAAAVFLSAIDGADAATRLECRRRAAEQLLLSGHIERGLETLDAVLGEVGLELPRSPRRALLAIVARRAVVRVRGLGWRERDESEIAASDLTRLDIVRTVTYGLALVDPIRAEVFQSRQLLAALRMGEPKRVARALAQEAVSRATGGVPREADALRLLTSATAIAERTGDPGICALVQGIHGLVAYLCGHFREALDRLLDAQARHMEEIGECDFRRVSAWEVDTGRLFALFAVRQMGSFGRLQRSWSEFTRDAVRRGDRYAETNCLRAFNVVRLARDEPDEVARDLERASWSPSEDGYHIQHWYELRARTELALYLREPPTLQAFGASFAALQRSLLPRVQMLRTEAIWLRGRAALAVAADGPAADLREALAVAGACARRLARERAPVAHAWGKLLAAGIAARQGDVPEAVVRLLAAERAARDNDLLLVEAAARHRRGELLGGDEGAALIASAAAFMSGEAIVRPDRMTQVLAGGRA